MATPSEKLAESLETLHKLQNANGAAAIRARDLTRTHRERLLKNGFLQEVMKGWYIPSRPDDGKGQSTAWYASFWRFAAAGDLDKRVLRSPLVPAQVGMPNELRTPAPLANELRDACSIGRGLYRKFTSTNQFPAQPTQGNMFR